MLRLEHSQRAGLFASPSDTRGQVQLEYSSAHALPGTRASVLTPVSPPSREKKGSSSLPASRRVSSNRESRPLPMMHLDAHDPNSAARERPSSVVAASRTPRIQWAESEAGPGGSPFASSWATHSMSIRENAVSTCSRRAASNPVRSISPMSAMSFRLLFAPFAARHASKVENPTAPTGGRWRVSTKSSSAMPGILASKRASKPSRRPSAALRWTRSPTTKENGQKLTGTPPTIAWTPKSTRDVLHARSRESRAVVEPLAHEPLPHSGHVPQAYGEVNVAVKPARVPAGGKPGNEPSLEEHGAPQRFGAHDAQRSGLRRRIRKPFGLNGGLVLDEIIAGAVVAPGFVTVHT